nr:MAG TPA: hypothetical protein [Caudoviricetes sp.]
MEPSIILVGAFVSNYVSITYDKYKDIGTTITTIDKKYDKEKNN